VAEESRMLRLQVGALASHRRILIRVTRHVRSSLQQEKQPCRTDKQRAGGGKGQDVDRFTCPCNFNDFPGLRLSQERPQRVPLARDPAHLRRLSCFVRTRAACRTCRALSEVG
jgi:hypothetical protein